MSGSNTFTQNRERLCKAIASLPEKSDLETVSTALGPIVTKCRAEQQSADERNGDANEVTPIMVACDKAQLSCLEYVQKQLLNNKAETDLRLWGHPLDTVTESAGGNSAIHFSATSGCAGSIDYLCSIISILQKHQSPIYDKHSQTLLEQENVSLCLLSQTNSHGDTPIMMASAGGHVNCLEQWTSRLLESSHSHHESEVATVTKRSIKSLFQKQNDSGDTALSLACGHGYYCVMEFLIHYRWDDGSNEGIVNATYEDVQKCKATMNRTDAALDQLPWDSFSDAQRQEYERRRDNMRRCVVMLQVASARAAQASMESLMAEDASQKGASSSPKKYRSNKKKKKSSRTSRSNNPKPPVEEANSSGDLEANARETKSIQSVWGEPFSRNPNVGTTVNIQVDGKTMTLPGFKTLQDGRVVQPRNSNQELNDVPLHESDDSFTTLGHPKQKTVKEMLRERYRDKDMNDQTIDAFMESLCLDASMLLLSPHGMALQLSPSQLDAVAGILEKQIDAVKEARQIQKRLRSRAG